MTKWVLAVLLMCGCKSKESPPATPGSASSPPPPVAKVVYEDYPVGVGPCRFVDIKDVSELLGAQLQYLSPEPDNLSCHLVPAIGHAAARDSKQATADEIAAEVPDLNVAVLPPDNAMWDGPAIPDLGEKAGWSGDRVQVLVKGKLVRIAVIDPNTPADALKDRQLAVAKKVVARVAAEP